MPRVTIDATEATGRELAEPGPYPMKVHSVGAVAQGEKAKYIPVRFDFINPEMAQKCGPIYRNCPIDGKGAGIFIEVWKATTGEQLAIGQQWDIDTDEMIGKEVIANVVTSPARDQYPARNDIGSLVAAA